MFGRLAHLNVPMLCFSSRRPSAGRLNHDFIDDGQTLKKYINHAYCAERAWGSSDLWVWLVLGESLGTPFHTK